MILVSTLLVGVVGLAPTAPELLEPVEPVVPGGACVAPVLYLGGPLGPCPEPLEGSEPSFVPALPHSAIDE